MWEFIPVVVYSHSGRIKPEPKDSPEEKFVFLRIEREKSI